MYLVYSGSNVFHNEGCALLPYNGEPSYYKNIDRLIKHGYRPCQCVRQEYSEALEKRNRSIILRMKYKYIFVPNSKVFHTTQCSSMRTAVKISGSYYYRACLLGGRRPCRKCNPVDEENSGNEIRDEVAMSADDAMRMRTEERAIKRHRQAVLARTALENNIYLPVDKKEDLYKLSSSSYAFFASKGYKTFHLRNCKKTANLKSIEGFSTYESACNAGYKPCRYCKPSDKHNVELSLPIYTTERKDESISALIDFCQANDYVYSENGEYIYVETRVGIWRMKPNKSPYKLEHINLVKTPNNREIFHQQPRLFLSMTDALYYIKRHDEALKFVWRETEYVPIQSTQYKIDKEDRKERENEV